VHSARPDSVEQSGTQENKYGRISGRNMAFIRECEYPEQAPPVAEV
jgi:hypothetical protein